MRPHGPRGQVASHMMGADPMRQRSVLADVMRSLRMVAAASILTMTVDTARAIACQREPGPTRTVVRVIDGETIVLDDGREVRLAGALAPRAMDVGAPPGSWPFEQQTVAALEAMVAGETVTLAYAGRRNDRYGRLLAHVLLDKAGERIWLEERLILQGLARAHGSADNPDCLPTLVAAETRARTLRIGIWGSAAYRVRRAGRRSGLARDRGTFQIVEGSVHRVVEAREAVSIYVGSGPGDDLAVRMPRSRTGTLLPADIRPRDLKSRLVRVRGWIEGERTPVIEIVHAGQIEIIERHTPGQGRRPVPRARRAH